MEGMNTVQSVRSCLPLDAFKFNGLDARNYIIISSETGDMTRDRFSHKRNVKMKRVFPENIFWSGNRYLYFRKIDKDIKSDRHITI